jgi:hypothetical protein
VQGLAAGAGDTEPYGAVHVTRRVVGSGEKGPSLQAVAPLPASLTQLNLHFDLSAPGVYQKWSAAGDELPNEPGCPDAEGCYYTLNGLVERSTGTGDLPVQPYFIYDSRLSGTSQHGVLWKGGEYFEETGWKPVIGQLASNADPSTDHGAAPETIKQRSTSTRVVPGADPVECRPSDLELNSLVVDAGEVRKATGPGPYDPELYTIQRTYRTVDLEVFYFNDRIRPLDNCDRTEPELRPSQDPAFGGKYHRLDGSLLEWRVLARDASDVWRATAVVTDNTAVDGVGHWEPVELERAGTERSGEATWTVWTGSKVIGDSQATYVVQAVDRRGNVGWLTYQSADVPASGVPLDVADTVEVRAPSRITRVWPWIGVEGMAVYVQGVNLAVATAVRFGGVETPVLEQLSDTLIKVQVPAGALTGPVEAVTAAGVSASARDFQVLQGPSETPKVVVEYAVAHEGDGALHFEVGLSDLAPTGGVSVGYATLDGRARVASDYVATRGTLTIPPGLRHGTISVALLDDTVSERREMFSILLGRPANATLAHAEALALILDDDGAAQTARRFRPKRQGPNR